MKAFLPQRASLAEFLASRLPLDVHSSMAVGEPVIPPDRLWPVSFLPGGVGGQKLFRAPSVDSSIIK